MDIGTVPALIAWLIENAEITDADRQQLRQSLPHLEVTRGSDSAVCVDLSYPGWTGRTSLREGLFPGCHTVTNDGRQIGQILGWVDEQGRLDCLEYSIHDHNDPPTAWPTIDMLS